MTTIGPTGEPPRSDLPSDRGGLNGGVTIRGDMIFVEFGTTLSYIAMTASEAEAFIGVLQAKLAKLRERKKP